MNVLSIIGASLAVAGNEIVNIDDNRTGADDFAGALMIYASDVIAAVGVDEDIPYFPDELRGGISDKISGGAKIALRIASGQLTLAQSFVSGKAAKALRYVAQVVRNLISGTPIPMPPTALTK